MKRYFYTRIVGDIALVIFRYLSTISEDFLRKARAKFDLGKLAFKGRQTTPFRRRFCNPVIIKAIPIKSYYAIR